MILSKQIFLIIILFFYSCDSKNNNDIAFVKENANYCFDDFYLKRFVIRERTKNELKIQLNEKDQYSNIIVNLLNDSIYVKDENRKLDIGEKNILSKFINLRIHYLEVDQHKNVKINLDDFENYDIIKIKDTSIFFQKHKRRNFEKVVEKWYLRIK